MTGLTRRRLVSALAAAVLCLLLPACHEDTTWTPILKGEYLEPTSADVLVDNLVEAYQWREMEAYTALLAPEFTFTFQSQDQYLVPGGAWTRGQDSTATAALFGSADIGDIHIDLVHGPPWVPADTTFDPAVRMVRVNPTQLQVDVVAGDLAGTTLQVDGDIQEFYARPGRAELGEDPAHWFLVEWRDLPSPFAVSGPAKLADTEASTWGRIKILFGGQNPGG